MRCEARRLRSFQGWEGAVPAAELARAGFFYLGPGDRVQCFYCGGVLRCWEPGDRPQVEHYKFFPDCPFVQADRPDGQVLGRWDDEGSQAVYPELESEQQRLDTYRNWPRYAEVSPEQLAQAGFFYTGHTDNVKCFHCDGGLRNWERGDDPWREHARWFPECEFLVQSKGQAFVRTVQEAYLSSPESSPETRQLDRRQVSSTDSPGDLQLLLQSSSAQGALQMGFDRSLVESLVQSRFLLTGAAYDSVFDLVTDLLQAEEEARVVHSPEPVRIPAAPIQTNHSEHQHPKEPDALLSTEEQLRRLKEERMCKVCMDRDVSMLFVPCGHLVVCTECAPNLRHCPICRSTIRGSVRAFMS
ncbi:baculoviral IAP repeat-containing protein 7 isoform X1 [Bombina bombina]|uniref:baculoviral IAP repeat-containing protein 7 isoform X1 n=1 Tax=Bombina bombina TaxID=8345 RepID=UPI00235A76E2|nr:baculoviral IAP repeat-containing protein 7 isoform X1 [Bombina bombina]